MPRQQPRLALLFALFASLFAASADAAPLQRGLFTPRQPGAAGATRFAVIGDQGTGDAFEHAMTARMAKVHDARPFAATLMLGDNVYNRGEVGKFDGAIKAPFAGLLSRGVRLYGILGNHDVRTQRGEAQLSYLGQGKQHWWKTTLADGDVDVFGLDTTLLVKDPKAHLASDEAWRTSMGQKQLVWLERALERSDATYKVVVGHHPMYSSGNRQDERSELKGKLEDLLVEHGVDAYLAGHQHVYERREPKRGITHIVSGNGARQEHPTVGRGRLPRVRSHDNEFMLFEAKPDGLAFQALGVDGRVIDEGVLAPKRR